MNNLYFLFFIIIINCNVSAQINVDLVALHAQAKIYLNQGDYSNAIVVYEDLLAGQELEFGEKDIRIAETLNHLGELYLLSDLPDIADYYFSEAIIIFQDSFQSGKNILERPLINLKKIYSFQNDTLMVQTIERQLESISNYQ